MRNKFADTFYELAKEDPRLRLIVADISPAGSIEKFRTEFPDRFLNVGVAEQVMIGMAAGMAQQGLRVFCYTIATFALYRAFEMVRDDLAYQNLPVTVVGIGGGLAYSTLGATHHAHEDIGVASAVPGLQVIAPCDPEEVDAATRWCAAESRAPTYLRLGKAGEPDLTSLEARYKDLGINPADVNPDGSDYHLMNLVEENWQGWGFGRLRYLYKGADVGIISYGPITKLALQVRRDLAARGLTASVAVCSTLKPLERRDLLDAFLFHRHIIVIEETTPAYGLGVQVRAIAQQAEWRGRIDTFGLQDRFIHCYGSHDDILAAHGLTANNILKQLLL